VSKPVTITLLITQGQLYPSDPVTINAGDTVQWINYDAQQYSITQTGVDEGFNSGLLEQNQTWSQIFESPGTYTYHNGYGAGLEGTVIVVEPPK
jgi:plastocyanin